MVGSGLIWNPKFFDHGMKPPVSAPQTGLTQSRRSKQMHVDPAESLSLQVVGLDQVKGLSMSGDFHGWKRRQKA